MHIKFDSKNAKIKQHLHAYAFFRLLNCLLTNPR